MVATTRATANYPVSPLRAYYGEGEDEHFQIWRGTANRKNMPLIVYVKPGHTFNMGDRVMDPHTSSSPALGEAVDLIYDHYNWPIASLELRPPYSADSPKREPFSSRPWPGTIMSLIKFFSFLREHANDEVLWGTGGGIDGGRIMGMGSSSGHTLLMLAACIPPGRVAINTSIGLTQSAMSQDHRPNCVVGMIGQVDWTQFALDPTVTSGPFKYDIMQYFFGLQSGLTWTSFNPAAKRSASPWYWVNTVDPARTAFWQAWGVKPTSGQGAQLTPDLWQPGTIKNTSPRAFFDPHHYFQAKPWHTALERLGCNVRTVWGDSSDNPMGPNNTQLPDSTDLANDIMRFIAARLRWPVVS